MAKHWFTDVKEFRQLCGDAQSMAGGESNEEFAGQMIRAANQYGLEAYLSESQLKWLCRIADWHVPARLK